MKTLSHKRTFALLAMLPLAPLAALSPAPAEACGPIEDVAPETSVRNVVAQHFAAINDDNMSVLLALWMPAAPVISVSTTNKGPAFSVDRIDAAVVRWIASTQPTRFTVRSVSVNGNAAQADIAVTWDGKQWDDIVLVTRTASGWKLAGKIARPVARGGAAGKSVY